MKNKKYLYVLLIIVPIIIFFVARSFSLEYTQEIKSVEIESDDYDNPGSWHIDKSAEWIDTNKARVTFEVNSVLKTVGETYKDIILVMDISGSMNGDKLDRAKQDAIDLTNHLLSDTHNNIALITFDSSATIVSNFINDKDMMLNYITNLSNAGNTNYNSAFLKVIELMDGYHKDDNHDLITLFLTDGYPNKDTPNEKATYGIIKDIYPYMTINGIQYEMGEDIIQEIIDVTDNQWIADQNSLHNVLFDAAIPSLSYDSFIITDYINDDYFYLNSVNDIKVDRGNVSLAMENGVQKILWNLSNNYKTMDSIKMTVDLELKEEYNSTKGFYPTNKSEIIMSKLPNEEEKTVNSTLTPVLKNTYYVIYDLNKPENCDLSSYDPEEHFVYQTITKKSENLMCPGYLFKGWVIEDNDKTDITIINDNMFVMPNHDVHIKGTWTKNDLVKTVDGEVHIKNTLYKVLQNEANNGTYAKKYTGDHQDSIDNSGTSDIYYYYSNSQTDSETILNEKNNVIFANHCWQMYRTTDTGGVKMIYNGEAVDDKCLSTRGTHVGYSARTSQNLASNYWYGTDYVYDDVTKKFEVSGTVEQATWNATVGPGLIGKYTCKSTSVDGTCSTLYFVESYFNAVSAYVIPLNSNSNYSQFGKLQFNSFHTSIADIGYMYNTRYEYKSKETTLTETMLSSNPISTTYWYASSFTWGSPVTKKYNLNDSYRISSTSEYPNLKGTYTFRQSSQTYTSTSLYYIAKVSSSTMYTFTLNDSGTHSFSNFNHIYTYGDSYIDNLDGTYTVKNNDGSNPQTIERKDWYDNYSMVGANKYVCKNAVNNTCNDLWYTTSTSSMVMKYRKVSDVYKYSKEVEYKIDPADNRYKYFLKEDDTVSLWNSSDANNRSIMNNHHYTCWDNIGKCNKVSYIFLIWDKVYYIELQNGSYNGINEMLYDDNVNTNDSIIKKGIDAWYKKYIYEDFDEYIEDTIFCNDRSQSYGESNGWNPNGGNIDEYTLKFKEYMVTDDLSCTNVTDRFSTLNSKAKLNYKAGLASSPEMKLLNNNYLIQTGEMYWLGSPSSISLATPNERVVDSSGYMNNGGGMEVDYYTGMGVRPVISLVPDIEYVDGDGSMEHPYLINDGTH
jgi:hypothetical protein